MKAIVKVILVALLLTSGISAKAQDVDGISLGDRCTKEQLIEKYGQLDWYHSQMDDDNKYLLEFLSFKDVYFEIIANKVIGFQLKSTKPKAMTKLVKGGIGLGDTAELLEKLKDYFFRKEEIEGGVILYSYSFGPDVFVYIGIKNNYVSSICLDVITT